VLPLEVGDDGLVGTVAESDVPRLLVLEHDYGVITRGPDTFLLRYYAKTGPELGNEAWSEVSVGDHLPLDIVPKQKGETVVLQVNWQGKPVSGAEVHVAGPNIEEVKVNTDETGIVDFPVGDDGLYSIRARHVVPESGEHDGKTYDEVRYYTTLALRIGEPEGNEQAASLPDLPAPVTSFGAAAIGARVYVYGGHTGEAHSYSFEEQSDSLYELDVASGEAWNLAATGPRLQGLALVAHDGKLFRIGGFTAKNDAGQPHELHSQDSVACFDPARGEWHGLPPLPEPRSSTDAVVLDGKLYVVGGWQLVGEEKSGKWHETGWALDLSAKLQAAKWAPLPKPPLQRRALALAAHDGRIYAIGGMARTGGPTTQVDCFDPTTGAWSSAPPLVGEPMNGFGCSACTLDGKLYVSCIDGTVQRLSEDGATWEVVKTLDEGRFFHRMLPISGHRLLMVGGSNAVAEKVTSVEVVDLAQN
jgi:N-acetylneuraminic acid mutarotase